MMKIEFLIDPANPGHVNAVNAFFNAFNGVATSEPTKKKGKPLNEVLAQKEEPAPKEEPTAPPVEKQENPLKVEDITTRVAEIVAADVEKRDKIKAKLTELGAARVSALNPENYSSFMQFLSTL